MKRLLEKLYLNHILTSDELTSVLQCDEINDELFVLADRTRNEFVGDEVYLRALIEFSNVCRNNCLYCGLRCANKNIERYKISPDDIILLAQNAVNIGYKTVVLQSGEADNYTNDEMVYIIRNLKKMDLAITLSIGEKTFEEYEMYKNAGADRYLLRIETTDEHLYKSMHPNMDINNRKQCLCDLKELGYEVGSGFLIGLPNQTLKSIADDLLFLKEIKVDMAGIGPFIPCPNTPLADKTAGQFTLALKTMALMRLLLPDINIPATTAMEVLNPNGRIIALQCGANVVMPNITIDIYKKKYLLYPGKTLGEADFQADYTMIKQKIEGIGRTVLNSVGSSKSFNK